jgi:site-specific DNA-methyltransferase (adenine-specific)
MEQHPITLLHGDWLTQIPLLKNRSIRAVITSPPYAQQRKGHYPGWNENDYPATMVRIFNAIKPKLTKDGSILMNIRSHVKDGAVSDYVLQARLALRKAGFTENEELIWYKPEAAPQGSVYRPRRSWENILWFSTCKIRS